MAQQAPAINPERTWIISDSHFGHENIKAFCHRPQDVENTMMEEWARAVSDEATLLHLGDLSWKNNAWFKNMIAPHLTGGRKLIVLGNHDKQRPSFFRQCGFRVVDPFEMRYHGWTISFSHYPLDHVRDPKHLHVHGHIHNNGYDFERFIPYRRNQINVSAEMLKYRPTNLKLLLDGVMEL